MADHKIKKNVDIEGVATFEQDVTIDQDLTVTGDLTVNGTTTTINTTDLDVTDQNITVNVTGDDTSSEGAGLTVERTGTNGSIIYADAEPTKFKVGALGSEDTVVAETATQTLTNKTISDASNTLTVSASSLSSGAAANGTVATADGAGNVSYLTPATAPNHTYQLSNMGFSATAAAGALTIALKQADGTTDPAASPATKISFRSTTATTAGTTTQEYTTATTIVIPSGATMGWASGDNAFVYVYGLYDGANKEIAVSQTRYDENQLHNTTAIDTSADSYNLYSTTARTSAAIRLLGRIDIDALTTAGTWTTPTRAMLNQFGSEVKVPVLASYESTVSQTSNTSTDLVLDFNSREEDSHSSVTTGASWKFTAPETGIYDISGSVLMVNVAWQAGERMFLFCRINGTVEYTRRFLAQASSSLLADMGLSFSVKLTQGDEVDFLINQNTGANVDTLTSDRHVKVTICRVD